MTLQQIKELKQYVERQCVDHKQWIDSVIKSR